MKENTYVQDRDNINITKLRRIRSEMPPFSDKFFRGISANTTVLTRLNYAYDLRIFFNFLINEIDEFNKLDSISDFGISMLQDVTTEHIEIFMEYLDHYKFRGRVSSNGEKAKARKLSSVRSFFKYYFNRDALDSNVSAKVSIPKLHDKEIVKLEVNEVSRLLKGVEEGRFLTSKQIYYHNKTKSRDTAMLTLFLGTGIRVSECVGIDIDDIDFNENAFTITRKGGNRTILYFGDEVAKALRAYMFDRLNILRQYPDERALFLSLKNTRISVRAVQQLVKKYTALITPLKKITPHKLRSTFGTNLYRETQDIYVVADVLGHKDVNTTKKHYASISEDIRRKAANSITLLDKDDIENI